MQFSILVCDQRSFNSDQWKKETTICLVFVCCHCVNSRSLFPNRVGWIDLNSQKVNYWYRLQTIIVDFDCVFNVVGTSRSVECRLIAAWGAHWMSCQTKNGTHSTPFDKKNCACQRFPFVATTNENNQMSMQLRIRFGFRCATLRPCIRFLFTICAHFVTV